MVYDFPISYECNICGKIVNSGEPIDSEYESGWLCYQCTVIENTVPFAHIKKTEGGFVCVIYNIEVGASVTYQLCEAFVNELNQSTEKRKAMYELMKGE